MRNSRPAVAHSWTRRVRLERLEDRCVPATIVWDGGPSGNGTQWLNPENWVGDVLPGPNDFAQVSSTGTSPTIFLDGNVAIGGGNIFRSFQHLSGTITIGAAGAYFPNAVLIGNQVDLLDGSHLRGTINGGGELLIAAGRTIVIEGTINLPINVEGILDLSLTDTPPTSLFNAPVYSAVDSTIRMNGWGHWMQWVSTTFTSSLTIAGTFELFVGFSSLNVANMAILPGGNFHAVAGTQAIFRTTGLLTNEGTLDLTHIQLSINSGASATNSGIVLAGDSAIAGGTFTSSGTISINTELTVSSTFNYLGGQISGGRLQLSGITNLQTDLPYSGPMDIFGTVNGPGSLTNPAGVNMNMREANVNAPFTNAGLVVLNDENTINGSMTTLAGSTLHIGASPSYPTSNLTVPSTFLNNGRIEISGSDQVAELISNGGTITSAASATIVAVNHGSGTRAIVLNNAAKLINLGTLTTTFTNLLVRGTTGEFTNAGLVQLNPGYSITVQGSLTNWSGSTWNGGVYDLGGSFILPNMPLLTTLGADIRLKSTGANVTAGGTNAFANLNAISAGGNLALSGGKTLSVTGALANAGSLGVATGSVLTVPGGLSNTGTLTGGGAVNGNLVSSGTMTVGDVTPGILMINGSANISGPVQMRINGTFVGDNYSQLRTSGPVTLGGLLNLSVGFNAPIGSQFRIVDNTGANPILGNFTGLPESAQLVAAGQVFSISYVGGTGNDVVLTKLAVPATAPRVENVRINDGVTQRSRVLSVAVTFNTTVTFAKSIAAALTLTRKSDGATANFTATSTVVAGKTIVTLTNFTGAASQAGSLADGRYTLNVRADNVSFGGLQLDGNGDGVGGDNYVLAPGDAGSIHRMFGDINGDVRVDGGDFVAFVSTYNLSVGNAGYLAGFDANGDGRVDGLDFGAFVLRYNTMLP